MEKKTKIILAVAVVVVVIAVIAIAASSSDDYDYEAQAKAQIDKYGYDSDVTVDSVEKGVNGFGMYIIKVTGTFVSGGESHTFTMTTFQDHEIATLDIDGRSFWGDSMGDATYNYSSKVIGPFTYQSSGGYTYTESPDSGMEFVLVTMVVKNVNHADGLSVNAPDFKNSLGNIYERDYSATSNHDNTYSSLSGMSIGIGNTVTYNLIYQVPVGMSEGEVVWDDMYLELYGYTLDRNLAVDDGA